MNKSKCLKITLIVLIFILFSCTTNIYASNNYYVGEKSNHERNVTYLTGVTEEMCQAKYWKDKAFVDINQILMNKNAITKLNKDILKAEGTMMTDLKNMDNTYNAQDVIDKFIQENPVPTRDLYINGEKIENEVYFGKIFDAINNTGYTGTESIKYGICTNRADIRIWPTDDVIGYSATDRDDENENSAMNLNEPFVITGKCEIDDQLFYWGSSSNCSGWVNAKNIAICNNKTEWLKYWNVDVDSNDFIVVTGSRIVLKSQEYDNINIMLGTILKLVPESEVPEDLTSKVQNNYIAYIPYRDIDGQATQKIAVLNKNLELNKGFLSLTENNILDVAFSCIGDEYGWGGMNGNMDCSMYNRSVYRCFGFELPRNTSWQQKIPYKYTDISSMTDEEKANYISTLPTGAMLYFPGHTMIYIGQDENKNFIVSDVGSLADDYENSEVEEIYAVTVNSLSVKRRNGKTWLNNLSGVVSLSEKYNLSNCEIELEKDNYIYDGSKKTPKVTVKYNGKQIYENLNFELEYTNNTEVGQANVNIVGKNNFIGTINKNFEIIENKSIEDEKQGEDSNSNTNDPQVNQDNNIASDDPKLISDTTEIASKNISSSKNPKTGDNIKESFILLGTATLGIIILCLASRKIGKQ